MGTDEKKTFQMTYDWASGWQDLPWAHQEPTLFLAEICARRSPGRVLDLGCGAGTDSVWLASQGWEVTALDFMPRALEYTSQRAAAAGVRLQTVEADITRWEPATCWDLVLDHGLLHNMDPARHAAYRERVLAALAADGDFVLLHWHPRYPGQPDGQMGPRRRPRAEICAFFAPELYERYFAREEFEDLPDIVGGGMAQACYWLRRNPAWHDPAGLLAQLTETMRANGLDLSPVADRSTARDTDDGLLARIIGPGRLGLTLASPEPADVHDALQPWLALSGIDAAQFIDLLRRFSAASAGGLCTANPRCNDCQVSYCKRMRRR